MSFIIYTILFLFFNMLYKIFQLFLNQLLRYVTNKRSFAKRVWFKLESQEKKDQNSSFNILKKGYGISEVDTTPIPVQALVF